ncbi:Isotrichodermin C-15 hydroxylase [Sphaceloma murrayae]|uniref:Isotrichodermin C-15 hydroxylase n=1 Tax=Sphaceloma murrayae TaxID=2082308 RepID=A0A2K1QVR8_9PEZI|nr:Isotrichodermin C-15 hydroxylase [Sphaceloma murrayae]
MADGDVGLTAYTVGGLLLAGLLRFLYRLYQVRKRAHYLPGPPHSWIWGHMKCFPDALRKLPNNSTPHITLLQIAKDYDLEDYFFLDSWPVQDLILITLGKRSADQFTCERSMPKSPLVADFTECVGGKQNLVADDGHRWKTWRAAFNPGFSNAHLMTLVPDIVDEVEVFCKIMSGFAVENKLFRMEKHVTRLTIDVIGKIVLDMDFHSQIKDHPLVSAFESSCKWMKLGFMFQPSELIDLRRPVIHWMNSRTMNKFIDDALMTRWRTRNQRGKTKYVIDLALETYLKDKGQSVQDNDELDPGFRKDVLDQVKIFLFAGHETSASTISYCLYHISRHPDISKKVHDELDRVFGHGANVGERIREEATLLNKLDYMMAVIKETLRMHAPANSVRSGSKDFFFVDPNTGEKFSTDGIQLMAMALGNHMHQDWLDPYNFRPERFLNGEAVEGAWVPFAKAPRSCIGQELATIEIRITLAMVLSEYEFTPSYDELHKLKGDGSGYNSETRGVQKAWGQEAYQTGIMAKPREGMPLRVRRRER